MNLTYMEQRAPGSPAHRLDYQVDGDVLRVTHTVMQRDPDADPERPGAVPGKVTRDTFDFSAVPAGAVVDVDDIETDLPVQPVLDAHRDDEGALHVRVLDWGGDRG